MEEGVLCHSLKLMTQLLQKHFGRQAILLIDEYDVPLVKAFEYGYYDKMVLFIRNLFEQTLKTNDSLQFAVLTGCMRISKESIFTGLNNLKVLSAADVRFDEYFGFTDREVEELLEYYGLSSQYRTRMPSPKITGPTPAATMPSGGSSKMPGKDLQNGKSKGWLPGKLSQRKSIRSLPTKTCTVPWKTCGACCLPQAI